MQKANVYSLVKKAKPRWDFKITDEANPNEVVWLVIKEPDIPLAIKVEQVVSEQLAYWLTPVDGELPGLPPIINTDGTQTVIELTEEMISLATTLYCLQDQPEELRYDINEIIRLIYTMEEGMMGVISKVREISEKFSELLENPTQAVITPLSPFTEEHLLPTQSGTTLTH